MTDQEHITGARCFGIVGSRAWSDLASVRRMATALADLGRPIVVAGSASIQAAVIDAAETHRFRGLLHLHVADKETGGSIDRDARFLSELAGSRAVLFAYLALDRKGELGRTHRLCEEAREKGITVIEIHPGPSGDPEAALAVAGAWDRALDAIDQADHAFRSGSFSAKSLYRAAVAMSARLLADLGDVERRLGRQWDWLDSHPMAADFAVREHRTLCLLATYTAISRVREALTQLVRTHGSAAGWDNAPLVLVSAEEEVAHAS